MMTLDQRRKLAHQARAFDSYCAGGIHQFQQKHEMSDEALAAWLSCSLEQLYVLCLCRIPGSPAQTMRVLCYIHARNEHRLWMLLCFLIALSIPCPDGQVAGL